MKNNKHIYSGASLDFRSKLLFGSMAFICTGMVSLFCEGLNRTEMVLTDAVQ